MSGTVNLEICEPIATITIANEAKRNVLSSAMWQQLERALREASTCASVRTTVLRGAGRSNFCAGGDLDEFEHVCQDEDTRERFVRSVEAAFAAVLESDVPVIAMLHGATVGGGMALACACDIRFADTALRMGIPAARIGVVPSSSEVDVVLSLIGPARTAELFYSGRLYDADEALRLGLVNRVLVPDDLEDATLTFAESISHAAPQALAATRRLIVSTRSRNQERQAEATIRSLGGAEFAEALSARRDGRQPAFPKRGSAA